MNYSAVLMIIITLLTAQLTALDLAKFRFPRKKLYRIMIIQLVITAAFNAYLIYVMNFKSYERIFFLTIDVPLIITFIYVSGRRDLRDLFTILVTIFISFFTSIPAYVVKNEFGNDYWWYDLTRIIIYTIVLLFLHKFVRKNYIQLQDMIEKGWGVFSILPLLASIALFIKYSQYAQSGDFSTILYKCIIMLTLMSIMFAVFQYIFRQLQEKYVMQEHQRILSLQLKAQRDQFEQQREAAEKTNRRWHDLHHNYQELIDLLEAGEVNTALSYLKEQQGLNEVPKEEYCLHPAVNSILCYWAARARKAEISVDIHAEIPDKLEIEPMELSALFANAFENAYEGCKRLPGNVTKYIKVEANYKGKRLAIGFTNSCLGEVLFQENMPVSTKEGGGIGTRSMVYTVSRFHGSSYFEAKNGIFSARFVLKV